MAKNSEQSQDRSLWSSILSFFRIPSRKLCTRKILRNENGFVLESNGTPNWSLLWDQVTGVVAYKRDLYSVDQICFGFRIGADAENLRCITEDTEGYKDIVDDISRKTDGAWPAMYSEVAEPTFEFRWTVLWTASGTPAIAENPMLHMIDPHVGSQL